MIREAEEIPMNNLAVAQGPPMVNGYLVNRNRVAPMNNNIVPQNQCSFSYSVGLSSTLSLVRVSKLREAGFSSDFSVKRPTMPCIARPRDVFEPDVVPPQPVLQRPDVINVKKRIRWATYIVSAGVVVIIVTYILYTLYGYPDPPAVKNETEKFHFPERHDEGGLHYVPTELYLVTQLHFRGFIIFCHQHGEPQ
ncbi:hypothetical protein JTE90_017871 [Oedothorax gibbosus]|uniref:Uncharacterized protein n=1 Tax=Oedothorax gibbosus TaxID=931172 RepID=A0AAV6V3E2_9ARAC|nr:hypothetical protein JTE90_017871 [Oedothorax gibbosus]